MEKIIIDETKLPKAMDIIERAASIMEEKDYINDDEIKHELETLQQNLRDIAGNDKINILDFQDYWGYEDLETVAKKALMPSPKRRDMTDNEIREIVCGILELDEAEMDYWLEFLEVNTGLYNLSDYIFYPDLVGLEGDSSMEEIAEKIIADRKDKK